MNTVVFETLGCKLNQSESEAAAAAFSKSGWNVLQGANSTYNGILPCLFILSTCTVTSKAEQKARRVIRNILKSNPQCVLIVTGCYAQLNKTEIEALDKGCSLCGTNQKRLFVLAGKQKNLLLALPEFISQTESNGTIKNSIESFFNAPHADPGAFADPQCPSFHSRAFLKIQDGCDNSCAYCRIHLARGKSISLDPQTILERLQKLEGSGFCEAVLSGVNICQYRSRLESGESLNLTGLINFLVTGTSTIALRLSSLDPNFLLQDEDFYPEAAHPRVRPHFHLSVQSLSDPVLARMNRSYNAETVMTAVKKLRQIKDDPFLACDIIAGFPGETDADFEQTLSLCQEADFSWIHVFPFSKRPGTAAFNFPHQVQEKIAGIRLQKLTVLANEGKKRYIVRWIGKEVDAIRIGGETEDGWDALSGNYLQLSIKKQKPKNDKAILPRIGEAFRCRIDTSMLQGI
ncbi:MAG: tRNA (N(6)-L-threonylcarbamoyladenosine(37)-C(2))-methylthiotransferase MtaB [Termitinemataceae bacterium]|nr:MAG: tRNA (N(6)-L-threonylcarbamoyladenosine(37)-C(2))-methylthiotransferase MtaB [Termitinemataceae bacterium]